ncbi:elongation factor P--(R)-beta-lysine ligase [Vibrio mangrovi]|uniref:Elongation factor P--(R)-beta-lysine ligase n=1 Tax=Vibrio mangrovi TaxID=474394 RepID=A0A1Y6J0E6_9VIBR|nr:elongation factor P--(R)-beta-lysine ligase [Vibrio mangrovi]MDW6002721.1 elongation factor P--(R)-beta-lysine ligase [Vibrio mangrovi]SMS02212.1 Elongation factor P--(R)-beta-lysine ligase [Vibrio mangrovi]
MPSHLAWKPTISMFHLRERARLIASVRHFLTERDVLEVETPSMSQATVTDIHLQTFKSQFFGPDFASGCSVYLMTSPEFHMKRLLAAGSGSIFQLCKAFRNEESGRYHNPEFTLLEWYRIGFDHHQLMDEMDDLLQLVLSCPPAQRMTYQQAFLHSIGVCPLSCDMDELRAAAQRFGFADIAAQEQDRDTLLQLLFSMVVEPDIGQTAPAFVYNFPASQAALARVSADDERVAERFEVYFKGIELANGFHELDDPTEQLRRFEADNVKRSEMGLEPQPIDYHLIQALQAGLPHCAGVALGIDRLVMLALKQTHIQDVITFPFPNA